MSDALTMTPEIKRTVLAACKQRFFVLALSEDYPNTPAITQELDALQESIRSVGRDGLVKAEIEKLKTEIGKRKAESHPEQS